MTTPHRSESFQEPLPIVEHAGKWFVATAIAFIVLGTLAILMPLVAGFAVTTLVGVLLLVAGVMHGISAFRGEGVGHAIWQIIVALFYVVAGVYFLGNPLMALTTLTMFLAAVLLVEGVINFVAYFQMRRMDGSGWLLVNSIVTFLLGLLIWRGWPSVSLWAIGTIVGINLIVNGFSRLMLGSTARSAARRLAA
jgi:uncharacterized membrane protein HdeD (DUF308 family)